MTTKINLENVELVSSFVGVKVSELDIQNDGESCVLVDKSQGDLRVAKGSFQGCCGLLMAVKESGAEFVLFSKDGVEIIIESVGETVLAA